MNPEKQNQARWLLLIHQIPPKPDYFRVKVWRRLQRLGAVAIKNSVYVLPLSDHAQEDFQWLARQVTEEGGEASVCEAGFLAGLSDAQIERLFEAAREADYAAIAAEAREIGAALSRDAGLEPEARSKAQADVARLRRRLAETAAIDFFDAPGRQTAEGLVADLEKRLSRPEELQAEGQGSPASEFRGRTWVTRKGVHVDRIGSAWLIGRFIDPQARFKFVPAQGYHAESGELRFDMFEAEFSHEGDRCTFEVLLERFKLGSQALRWLAEIVHDIDLKDGKFGRPETPGVQRLIEGLCRTHKEDDARLARGSMLFDDLHAALAQANK